VKRGEVQLPFPLCVPARGGLASRGNNGELVVIEISPTKVPTAVHGLVGQSQDQSGIVWLTNFPGNFFYPDALRLAPCE